MKHGMKDPAKARKVMREFKEGELRSGSKHGPKVKSRDQAQAIAMSEAGMSKKRNPAAPFGHDGVFSGRGKIGIS